MRTALAGIALIGCLSAVWAEGGGTSLRKPVAISAATLHHLQQGLTPAERLSLAGTITPAQQLAALQSNPTLRKRLQQLKLKAFTPGVDMGPWEAGITLTPLAATYPAGGDYGNFSLALRTEVAWLSQMTPLPFAGQNPPLLWLWAPNNSSPLFRIEAKWPMRAAYLVTFFMKDVIPNSVAQPRVWQDGGLKHAFGNAPSGGDQWTILWLAPDPQNLYHEIKVYPSELTAGFVACCLSKVVVSKFWLE